VSGVSDPVVAVIGAGSWGTTVAALACEKGLPTRLWARREEVAVQINKGYSSPYLPGVFLPFGLRATTDLSETLENASIVIVAVPSHAFRAVTCEMAGIADPDAVYLSLAKGIEQGSLLRMSEILRETLPGVQVERVGALSGPNLALEIARRQPATTVIAIPDPEIADLLQRMFISPTFRVYTNPDLVGVELGGAIKNVMAIAVGVADGVGVGDNAKAALVTRGLAELTRLGVKLGGHPMTFAGLAGVGDLIATCMSPYSRNRHLGEELGKGRSLTEVLDEMKMVAEGVSSTRAICDLAMRAEVEMPIAEQVAKLLYEGENPIDMAMSLLTREAKSEIDGYR